MSIKMGIYLKFQIKYNSCYSALPFAMALNKLIKNLALNFYCLKVKAFLLGVSAAIQVRVLLL